MISTHFVYGLKFEELKLYVLINNDMNVTSLLIVFYLSHLIQSPEKIRKLAKIYSRTIGTVEVNNTTAIDNILTFTDYNRSHFFYFDYVIGLKGCHTFYRQLKMSRIGLHVERFNFCHQYKKAWSRGYRSAVHWVQCGSLLFIEVLNLNPMIGILESRLQNDMHMHKEDFFSRNLVASQLVLDIDS
ncbi:hypothetical protein AGLY_007820 [Aphis glycines]|uniref:Uncharacterized protein n=1 Tax=Aphis glycines TaxID=307491 RepID=A0A6G0TN61_APHGL|nr:hypothetical protein AGLY_007820 [Aphis glycines]